ncbi:hypothetical protein [Aeromonas veronii]|uniref:hypothetical protein n=1 Tax=Aeromonas veronii TaxID=654 RepID=UPI00366EECDA
MARDNFTKSVIETLKARVSHRCSNPDCRVPTSAPSNGNKAHTIGVAAHICAASPGGPRYNAEMSTHERKDINNAIWLCQNCSVKIDRDPNSFSVDLLNSWKIEAERKATLELGKKLPSDEEAVSLLTAALTGHTNNAITNVIRNSHKATNTALENLDPRFKVQSSYNNGITTFTLHAKENVPIAMTIFNRKDKPYDFKKLFEQGQPLEIDSGDLHLEGSKLLEKITGDNKGSFRFEPNKLKAIHKLWLVNEKTHELYFFDEIDGYVSVGSKYLSYKGSACDGLFEIGYLKSRNAADKKTTMSMSLKIEKWNDANIINLPFFEKLKCLISNIANGWLVFTSLEIDGETILKNTGSKYDDNDFTNEAYGILEYTNNCRIIAKHCKKNILFSSSASVSQEDSFFIAELAHGLENTITYNASDIKENPTLELIADDGCQNIQKIKNCNEPGSIRIVQSSGDTVRIFNQEVTLPPKVFAFESVIPRVLDDMEDIKENDHVLIELSLHDNFTAQIFYENGICRQC